MDSDTTIVEPQNESKGNSLVDNEASTEQSPPQHLTGHPKRKCTEKTEYTLELVLDYTEIDQDYLPHELPHRRNKSGHSSSRMNARTFDNADKNQKQRESETPEATQDQDDSGHDGSKQEEVKPVKGHIDIKTYGIPKTTKERKMNVQRFVLAQKN